ncbi:MAG TPA: hypothetical protein VK872_03295 [Draconibacterium sp.]|nr:hypothetical protein [Draconibacterium sp.]
MELSLFAANGGKQTDLVISMVDHDNQFIKTIIHVHVPEMRKMHKVVENIESEFEKGRKSNKDKDLFK